MSSSDKELELNATTLVIADASHEHVTPFEKGGEEGFEPAVQKSPGRRWTSGAPQRPQRDSNPRYRRERPASWAGLDDGDIDFQ